MGSDGAGQPVIDIYARISRAVNGETIKTDYQVEVCSEELAARGARVGRVFTDPSLSAWKPAVVCPDWEAMMARLESGACDGVIFYDVTRYSRKVTEGERLVELAARGLRVWSLTGEYDLATADGRWHFREDMVSAASESDKISERVRHGKLRRARRGRLHGGGRTMGMPGLAPPPDGWQPGDPRPLVAAEVWEAERVILRECGRRLLAGETLSSVVRDLNARGIGTIGGKRWTRDALRRTLLRPSLAGLVVRNGEVIAPLAGIDPVFKQEDWERLRVMFESRPRGRPAGLVHLLSGLWVCGRCGHKILGVPRRELPPYPDGSPQRVYRCRKDASHFGCGHNTIDGVTAEQIVAEAVRRRLGDPRRAERVAARLAAVREQRAALDAEAAALEESADNLAAKTAEWGLDRVDKAMRPILARLQALHAERAALEEPETAATAAGEAAAAWDEAAASGDTAAAGDGPPGVPGPGADAGQVRRPVTRPVHLGRPASRPLVAGSRGRATTGEAPARSGR